MSTGLTAMHHSLGASAYWAWLLGGMDEPARREQLAWQWAALMQKAVKRCTQGESTSVPVWRAQQLSESLGYTIGL